ncbi:hypothetical protein PsYK624_003570 [Phanerochaete sordida]|uniref:Uncharacterized protein n=1 Tax=Phanerochaete sordida TaxID=48140 RepID=A0A9P3L6Q8_9APHY|nr:hypothetical protein PsYK624_003570 [Phanerochaete sordida]
MDTLEGPWGAEAKPRADADAPGAFRHAPPAQDEQWGALPFFGPRDPPRWPLHKTFFLAGGLCPPLWFVGGWLPVRDDDDNWSELFRLRCQAAAMVTTIVGVALLILLTAFDRP